MNVFWLCIGRAGQGVWPRGAPAVRPGEAQIRSDTMNTIRGLGAIFLFPVAAVAFSVVICGALVVSLTIELSQQLWQSR